MLSEAAHDLADELERRASIVPSRSTTSSRNRAEHREDLGGLRRLEIRQYEGDGLRLFVLDEIADLPAFHLGNILDHVDRGAGGTDAGP